MEYCYYESPIGIIKIEAKDNAVCRLEICGEGKVLSDAKPEVIAPKIIPQIGASVTKTEVIASKTIPEAMKSPDAVNPADKPCPVLVQAMTELTEYFAGTRKIFTVPVVLEGTEFQKLVWQSLWQIPYGETCSYGQIAEKIGNSKASRAVGMANNRNPVMIIVPCHRVIGKDGSLVGFGGGLEAKKYLLDLEKGNFTTADI